MVADIFQPLLTPDTMIFPELAAIHREVRKADPGDCRVLDDRSESPEPCATGGVHR